ncbi:MAG: hypothetical protein LC749_22405, partial [Actinobacteria bacterium]|nr:hypothetical protein [Actinomycetota bacterium]
RAVLITPTDRGRDEVAAARKVIAEIERSCARTIGRDRYQALMEDLVKLTNHVAGLQHTR